MIGQGDTVESCVVLSRRNRAGFDEGNRPIGSFLFVGPTGVGKTELAKQLAGYVRYGDAIIPSGLCLNTVTAQRFNDATAGYVV